MCLAIPMRVTNIEGSPDDFTTSQIATVDADGISKEVRLDVVDRWPDLGDYVIVPGGGRGRDQYPAAPGTGGLHAGRIAGKIMVAL